MTSSHCRSLGQNAKKKLKIRVSLKFIESYRICCYTRQGMWRATDGQECLDSWTGRDGFFLWKRKHPSARHWWGNLASWPPTMTRLVGPKGLKKCSWQCKDWARLAEKAATSRISILRLKARVDLGDQMAEFMPFEVISTAILTYLHLTLGTNVRTLVSVINTRFQPDTPRRCIIQRKPVNHTLPRHLCRHPNHASAKFWR